MLFILFCVLIFNLMTSIWFIQFIRIGIDYDVSRIWLLLSNIMHDDNNLIILFRNNILNEIANKIVN